MGIPSIFFSKEYGSIVIDIETIMLQRGISRNKLSTLTGISYKVINKWHQGNVERIDANILAKICYTLDCDVVDVIKYVRPK